MRLDELYALPPPLLKTVKKNVPAMEMIVHELAAVPLEALARLRGPPIARFALVIMRAVADGEELASVYLRCEALVRASRRAQGFTALVSYTLEVGRVEPERLSEVMSKIMGPKGVEIVKTGGQILKEQGRAEGREEGLKQGLRDGVAETLARLLRVRFGPLDEATRSRLDGASIEDLEKWAERVLDAERIEAVFGSTSRRHRGGRGSPRAPR